MAVQFVDGQVLLVGGAVAMDPACCCGGGVDCQDIIDHCPPEWFPSSITISGMDKCPCLAAVRPSCGFATVDCTAYDAEELVVGDDFSLAQRCDSEGTVFARDGGNNKYFYINLTTGDCEDVLDGDDPPVDRQCLGLAIRLRLLCSATPPVWRLEIKTRYPDCSSDLWLAYEREFDEDDEHGGLYGDYDCVYDACATASGSVTVS